jgi:hypothetical protein
MNEPRCTVCGSRPNAWCREYHVPYRQAELALRQAALAEEQARMAAFRDACDRIGKERTE